MAIVRADPRSVVLVLDGNENQAVSAVRTLAHAGYSVVVGADRAPNKAAWSRWALRGVRYPSPRQDPESFVNWVVDFVASESKPTVVLPMTESTTAVLARAAARLREAGVLSTLPSVNAMSIAFDKSLTSALAIECGFQVPASAILKPGESVDELWAVPAPFVVKATNSNTVSSGKLKSTGRPRYAASVESAKAAAAQVWNRNSDAIIQQFVEGEGVGYFAFAVDGQVRCEFSHRRIRDVHPTGSGSCMRESIAVAPDLRERSVRLIEKLNWTGPIMIETRRTLADEHFFIEVNGRLWGSLALAESCGAPFSLLMVQHALDKSLSTWTSYRTHLPMRWIVGELRHLLGVIKGPPADYPGRFPRIWSTIKEQLADTLKCVPSDNFRTSDPFPAVADVLDIATRGVFRS